MKTLYLIGGPMGVGKTAAARILQKKLPDCAFLDGDWCWDSDPFIVTEETKAMVMDNICHILNGYLHCSGYENVILCWVMHEQDIIDALIGRLDLWLCGQVNCVTLIADENTLRERLGKDIAAGLRNADIIGRSLERARSCEALGTLKIDTSGLSAEETAQRILGLCGEPDDNARPMIR